MDLSALKPRQVEAIRLLVSGMSGAAVARELQLDKDTIYRWRRDPDFDSAYTELQQQITDDLHGMLVGKSTEMIGYLVNIAGDEDGSPMARVQAIRSFFELLGVHKGRPIERPDRVEEVETLEQLIEVLSAVPAPIMRTALRVIEGGRDDDDPDDDDEGDDEAA